MAIERRYLGIEELAQYIGITKGTAYIWIHQRKLPHFKVGKLVKFDIREIDEWMKERKVDEFN